MTSQQDHNKNKNTHRFNPLALKLCVPSRFMLELAFSPDASL